MSDDDVRVRADERRRMLGELELERNQLYRNIETCRIRDIDRPFIGDWSLKDIVGHVVAWEAEFTSALKDLREGRRPRLADFDAAKGQAFNDENAAARRETPFWTLLDQLHQTRAAFLDELGNISDEELTEPGGGPARIVKGLMDHDREHWHQIAAKLAGMAGVRPVSSEQNEAATTTST